MKLLRVVLGVALTGLLPATAATAQPQVIQSRDADRELFAVAGPDGLEVRDGERTVRVELPDGARLASLEALADGWVAAGTRTVDGETGLWLSTGRGDESELLPLPPGVGGRYLNRPVPLIERGRLAGLAWLEGERHDALSVRAAVWSGRSWSEPVTVSPPDLESQLALSGAVLPDGSWQLVWAAVDGADDEIFSARRRIDGNWEARRQLNPPNDVPDILPQIVATDAGSLIAWNELHEGHYRVRLVRRDLERRERIGFVGPAGSVSPRLLAAEGGAVLLYKAVLPDLWTALEVDSDGTPLRMAMAAVPGYGPPVIVSTGAALRFSGMTARPAGAPEAAGEEGVEMEIPWQAFERELLEEVSPAPGAAAGPAGAGGPAQAGAGTVIYRAFGDSIGRGSGDPVAPSIVFDIADDGEAGPPPYQACAPNGNPFAILCGYNWRLEDTLNASFAADVANDGRGGEGTVTGLSRIDGVLASGGDVVLIMEGSNDLTGCSTAAATVRDNIAGMVNKATAAGFDSVIASVAKRRRVDTAGNPVADPCGEDAATTSLKDLLSTLATQKNRAFANVWTAIDPALGQTDYWNAGGGQNDIVGHPDISGYGKIEPKFSAPILADSFLGAPSPLTPSGNVTANPPFSWNKLTGARLYRLSIAGPGAPAASWHDSLAICPGSVCTVNLAAPLNAGSHSWQVAGKNLRGLGSFSAAQAFEVFTTPPAAAPATGEPIGACNPACYDAPPPNPLTYYFTATANASDYDLEVHNSGGGLVFGQSFPASSICTGGNCAALSGTGLAAGDYTWRVRGRNPVGNGTWSAMTSFSIYDSAPAAPTPFSPAGETFDATPKYSWSHVAGATDYRLEVPGAAGFPKNYSASAVCSGSMCEDEPADTLAIGAHVWRVRGESPLGPGSFTADLAFEVLDCGLFPDDLSLDGANTGSQIYRACPGTVTSKAGFVVATGETVTLHGAASVVIEEITVQSGATVTFKTN